MDVPMTGEEYRVGFEPKGEDLDDESPCQALKPFTMMQHFRYVASEGGSLTAYGRQAYRAVQVF